MIISYKWLSEYVENFLSPEEIADKITQTGLEVEGIEKYSNYGYIPDELIVGEVMSVEKHPDADKLTVCKVNINSREELNIVCGAPNVSKGQKVVVAPVGVTLHTIKGDKLKIQKAKIRGIESEGMLCAEDEIGIGHGHDGIMVLPDTCIPGKSFRESLNVYDDTILEVAVTPNRGDAISHIGVARDLAATLKQKVSYPSVENYQTEENTHPYTVEIRDTDQCLRYTGVVLTHVTVKESPDWLQNRLKAIGTKPINNIVDVANYVMYEMGQPLHIFDLKKLTGNKIITNNLKKDSTFITLDQSEVKLNGEEIMICDAENPIAMGGIMGGKDSMVTESTTEIFIESACFNPSFIRKAARYHGFNTDASYRFERGTNPNNTLYALKRAALLLKKTAGGKISSDIIDVYPNPILEKKIFISFQFIDEIIGNKIDKTIFREVLQSLEYIVKDNDNQGFEVMVPTYRGDVTGAIDLIEEFLRIYSFDKIEFSSSVKSILPNHKSFTEDRRLNAISQYLAHNGFFEILTPSFINSEYMKKAGDPGINQSIKALNTVNSNLDTLRTELIYTGLETIAYNINRDARNVRCFEFGKLYSMDNKNGYHEEMVLGIWTTGDIEETNWITQSRKADFYYLKTYVENVNKIAGVKSKIEQNEFNDYRFIYALKSLVEENNIAEYGKVNSNILDLFDIRQEVFYAVLYIERILKLLKDNKIQYQPPIKYPPISRDLSFLIENNINFAEINNKICSLNYNILKEIRSVDVYEGENIPVGKKSYTIRMKFQDENKTLKDEQVNRIVDVIINLLEKEFNAIVRKK